MTDDSYRLESLDAATQDEVGMNRRDLLSGGSLLLASALAGSAVPKAAQAQQPQPGAPSGRKPNVLLILTDNTGWGDWGAYGGGILRGAPSPRVDGLAAEGMRLLNFNTEP